MTSGIGHNCIPFSRCGFPCASSNYMAHQMTFHIWNKCSSCWLWAYESPFCRAAVDLKQSARHRLIELTNLLQYRVTLTFTFSQLPLFSLVHSLLCCIYCLNVFFLAPKFVALVFWGAYNSRCSLQERGMDILLGAGVATALRIGKRLKKNHPLCSKKALNFLGLSPKLGGRVTG